MDNETTTDAGSSPVERPVRPDPMREAFEAYYSSDGQWPAAVERSFCGLGYKLGAADHAWNAWQACWPLARAAIYSAEQAQIEAPLRSEIDRLTTERQDLVLMVGRLLHRMRAARDGRGIVAGDDALEQQVLGYLRRKGLTSPLREEGPNV